MSLRFDGVGDYARYQGAAGLGNTTSGTLLGLYRKEDSTADRDIIALTRSGGGAVCRIASSTQIRVGYTAEWASSVLVNLANNTWMGLALTLTDSQARVYTYSGGVLTLQITDSSFFSATNLANCYFGDQGSWSDAALGCWRYGRFWSRILTSTELEDEFAMTPASGTPAASTTNLRGSWPMANSTDTTDWSGVGNTLTISGAVTSSDEPSIGGGGGSVLPLPQRPPNMFMRM